MCVCIVLLVIQNAVRMRRIFICDTTFVKALWNMKHVR
jgi:hypothetical protein